LLQLAAGTGSLDFLLHNFSGRAREGSVG